MRQTQTIGVLLIITVLVLVACGTTAPAPSTAPGASEVFVHVSGYSPQGLTVPVGTTVTWISVDIGDDHTITSDASLFDANLSYGNTFSYTFTEPGTYPYHCVPHPDLFGTVIVE